MMARAVEGRMLANVDAVPGRERVGGRVTAGAAPLIMSGHSSHIAPIPPDSTKTLSTPFSKNKPPAVLATFSFPA